jgi:hypothetical protein
MAKPAKASEQAPPPANDNGKVPRDPRLGPPPPPRVGKLVDKTV